jgi:hypothetical protein
MFTVGWFYFTDEMAAMEHVAVLVEASLASSVRTANFYFSSGDRKPFFFLFITFSLFSNRIFLGSRTSAFAVITRKLDVVNIREGLSRETKMTVYDELSIIGDSRSHASHEVEHTLKAAILPAQSSIL